MSAILAAGCRLAEWNGGSLPAASQDDPCGSGARTGAGHEAIHRLPYLQNAEPTAVTVAWAGLPDAAPRVAIARKEDPSRAVLATFAGEHPGPASVAGAQRTRLYDELYEDYDAEDAADDHDDEVDEGIEDLDAEDFYGLAARVGGLDAGRRYCYRLENDRGPLTEWASLMTAPPLDPARVDRFIVLGDSGSGQPAQIALARRISRLPIDAILFLGDIAYRSGTPEQLQERFFAVYADIFQRVPSYVAIGNHDNRTDQARPLEEALWLPGNERWYSFDLGDVHFIVLDTTRIGRAQATWLDRELARDKRRYTIVLAHHPPYTSGSRGGSAGFRTWFVPVLERHRVDLVLVAHDHHYERLKPIGGIVYIISGGGGGRLTYTTRSSLTARLVIAHHFLVLEAHADRLLVRAIDIHGNVIDELAIEPRHTAGGS